MSTKADVIDEMRRLYEVESLSLAAIAQKYQRSAGFVACRLRSAGVKIRPAGKCLPLIPKAVLTNFYVNQKFNASQVAKKLGFSMPFVYKCLKAHGIARRISPGKQLKHPEIAKLRMNESIVLPRPARQVFQNDFYKMAQRIGIRVSVKTLDDNRIRITRVPETFKKISDEEIQRLLNESDSPIGKIAEEIGITRTALYHRIKLAQLDKGKRNLAPRKHITFPEALLTSLYVDEGLTVRQVADKLGTSVGTVTRLLREIGVAIGSRGIENQYDCLKLEIGESLEIPVESRYSIHKFSGIYRRAKTAGIRIAIKNTDHNTAVMTRTPDLTLAAIRKMIREGLDIEAIARAFVVKPNRIRNILGEKKGGNTKSPPK